jgi:CheY-like chemotaxis protein
MQNFKILVIDDDATTCTLLETILQMEDFETASVNSIEHRDILAILIRENPQLLFMDYHLGSQDTLRYVAVIKADTGWRHLPIIMTSGIDHRQKCLAAGADRFILKPFKWQEVTKVIKELQHSTEE